MIKNGKEVKDERYIYNIIQAEFFLKNGALIQKMGVHPVTKRVFFMFKYIETIEQMDKWMEQKGKGLSSDGKSINS